MLRTTSSPTALLAGFMVFVVLADQLDIDPALGMGALAGVLYLCLLVARPFRRASLLNMRRTAAPTEEVSA